LEKGRNKILLLLLFLHTHPQEVLLDLLLRLYSNKTTIPIPHTTFYTRRKTQFFFFFFTEHLLQIPTSAAEALFLRGQNVRKPWEEESQQQQQQQQMSLSFSPAKA
jgi:hypothetical protein